MKPGYTVYFLSNNQITQGTVIKLTRDFVTVRYKTYIPDESGRALESIGGIRLRRNRVFSTKQEAEEHLNSRK